MGKLIVFEGTDGTGKSTQFALLTKRLQSENIPFRRLQFPQYLEPSSALIRMYLNGEFGENPNDVNAYAASTFYAVDRRTDRGSTAYEPQHDPQPTFARAAVAEDGITERRCAD